MLLLLQQQHKRQQHEQLALATAVFVYFPSEQLENPVRGKPGFFR